ncbi:helix-hairpin-helix domain-containing protein [Candidatus Bipolaricaulota bacterium]|nr:helix-hairpin-helix domain-containing protein [Candidatus Bipolaricaulota bacterium]
MIYPPAADDLGIPLNEIWISDKPEEFEKYILYHEIREIKHRAKGHDVSTAHEKAVEDEKVFEGDPEWEKLRREINVASPEILQKEAGIESDTFEEIMQNRPYYRMKELQDLNGIDEQKYKKLKENFWSFY